MGPKVEKGVLFLVYSLFKRNSRAEVVATCVSLAELLASRSAFISQKCILEYCRARAGFDWEALVKEPPFEEALNVCHWQGYSAVAQDLGLMLEGSLRPQVLEACRERLHDFMLRAYAGALLRYPEPQSLHRGWQGEIEDFATRLAQSQMRAPGNIMDLGMCSGRRIYSLLPIHPRLRAHDEEMICNNVRFGLLRAHEDFQKGVDYEAIAAEISRGEWQNDAMSPQAGTLSANGE